jgi:hypothetical protein
LFWQKWPSLRFGQKPVRPHRKTGKPGKRAWNQR